MTFNFYYSTCGTTFLSVSRFLGSDLIKLISKKSDSHKYIEEKIDKITNATISLKWNNI